MQQEGKKAEEFIATYLLQNGHRILAQNFRGKGFEIDIISEDAEGVIIGHEIKLRSRMTYCCQQVFHSLYPQAKRRRLQIGMGVFLRQKNKPSARWRNDGYIVSFNRSHEFHIVGYYKNI